MTPRSQNRPQYRLGLILVTASAIAWSTAGYFTRLIPLDNWTLLFWRGVFAAVGILAFMLATQGRAMWRDFAELRGPGWLLALLSTVGMVCYITSLTLTTVAHVAIIYGIVPFVAAGMAWLAIHERPSPSAMAASLIALVGVAVMVGSGPAEGSLLGDLLAFAMTLCMAGIMVLCRRHRDIPIRASSCLSVILSVAATWPLASHALPPTGEMFGLALFGLVNLAFGIIFFTFGARLIPAVETALIGSLDAPLAPVWVWLAFGETPSLSTILGGILVFGAVLANISLGTRSRAAA